MAAAPLQRWQPRMATTRPLSRIPAARLRPQTLVATLQEAAPTSSPCTTPPLGDFPPNPPPPPKIRGGKKGRRKGGAGVTGEEGACTASPPPGVKARPPEGRPPPLPEAGGRRVHGSADDARKSKDRATQEPELFKPLTTTPSPSRTPCFLFTVLFAAAPERQGAGLLHMGDVAVEAMDRAALLPLLQAIPRCSSPPPRRRVQSAR
jgi:hypothetical protein